MNFKNVKYDLSAKLRVCFVLTYCLIVVYSCKKEIVGQLDNKKQSSEKVNWAIDYYEKNLKEKTDNIVFLSSGKIANVSDKMSINIRTPHWRTAEAGENSFYEFIETDITSSRKTTPTFKVVVDPNQVPQADLEVIGASFDRLLIFKDKNGFVNQRVITYVPDIQYYKKNKGGIRMNRIDKLQKNFFGYLYIKSWEGSPLYILRIENGKAVQRYGNLINLSNANFEKKVGVIKKLSVVDSGGSSGGGNTCLYLVTWDWQQTCYYGSSDITPIYCDPPMITNVNYVATSCVGSAIDCTDISNFYDFRCVPGGGGGGSVGTPSYSFDIKDDLPLPCESFQQQDFADTIRAKQPLAREAIKSMLPPQYASYIGFDTHGNLNLSLLNSAKLQSNMPSSEIYDALVYVASKPNFNINVIIGLNWYAHTEPDPTGSVYTFKDNNGVSYDGVTVTPGVIPSITNPTVTGIATEGSVYVNSALSSSFQRLAFVTTHELLGHMYLYLKNDPYQHNSPTADAWILKIEREANKNWKLIKKWKKSKEVCQVIQVD